MNIVIETPKYSFVKYAKKGRKYVKAMTSPFPTLFNYGFIKGTFGKDGMPEDCIVLGRKLAQGQEIELNPVGVVNFTDDRKEDDKRIFAQDNRVTSFDKIKIHSFFTAYATYKTIRYKLEGNNPTECKYEGFRLF